MLLVPNLQLGKTSQFRAAGTLSTLVMRGDTSGDQWSEQQGREARALLCPQVCNWKTQVSSFCLKFSNKKPLAF